MTLYADIRRVRVERGARRCSTKPVSSSTRRRKVGELSGGMRQRLGFALALLTDPAILVLDEPSASLDTASRSWLADRLRDFAAEGRTVLVSTHAGQELLDTGHRRIVLEDGRVITCDATAPPRSRRRRGSSRAQGRLRSPTRCCARNCATRSAAAG